jgi:hypothetical protein
VDTLAYRAFMAKNVFQSDNRYVVHGNVEKCVEAAKED